MKEIVSPCAVLGKLSRLNRRTYYDSPNLWTSCNVAFVTLPFVTSNYEVSDVRPNTKALLLNDLWLGGISSRGAPFLGLPINEEDAKKHAIWWGGRVKFSPSENFVLVAHVKLARKLAREIAFLCSGWVDHRLESFVRWPGWEVICKQSVQVNWQQLHCFAVVRAKLRDQEQRQVDR